MQVLNVQRSVVNMVHSVNRIEEDLCLCFYRGKLMNYQTYSRAATNIDYLKKCASIMAGIKGGETK